MKIEIKPEETGGEVYIPPSKSITHRAIIAAALANGTSRIDHVILSEDIKATLDAVKAFGAEIDVEQETEEGLFTVQITGDPEPQTRDVLVDCSESGSTIRFILPIIALDSENTVITGKKGLARRPLDPYFEIFDKQGISYEKDTNYLPIILTGNLKPDKFYLRGDISSQFITGLLLALPLLDSDSEIILTTKLESKPYITLTIEILKEFGIEIIEKADGNYLIPGDQHYRPTNIKINGDFSQAAFWFVNGLINKKTILKNLPKSSIQGDFEIIDILNNIGASIKYDNELEGWISEPAKTKSFIYNLEDTPDLVPILAVIAGLSKGTTKLKGLKRLHLKESDRVFSTAKMLESYGVKVEALDEELIIYGQENFTGGVVDPFNDHRIAIASAIASGRATGDVVIEDAQCVNKSYPNFWEEFRSLGGDFSEFDMGN